MGVGEGEGGEVQHKNRTQYTVQKVVVNLENDRKYNMNP